MGRPQFKNCAVGIVSTTYDAAVTSIDLTAGHGARFPSSGGFYLLWWNSTDYPDPTFDPNTPGAVTKAAGGGDADTDDADSDGLTKAEITADLEAAGVEFDPRAKKADLLALRNEHRAQRDA